MFQFDGSTYGEIAQRRGLSPGAVRKLRTKASQACNAAPTLLDPVRRQAFRWQVTLWPSEITPGDQAAFARRLAADPAHAVDRQNVERLNDRGRTCRARSQQACCADSGRPPAGFACSGR